MKKEMQRSSASWWKILLITIALPFAMSFGSRWNAAAVPIRDATLSTREVEYHGDVYRRFDGSYEIHEHSGKITRVPTQDVSTFQMMPESGNQWRFALENWRFYAPTMFVFLIFIIEIFLQMRGRVVVKHDAL